MHRPGHHWFNAHTGQYTIGSQCKLYDIIIPQSTTKTYRSFKGKQLIKLSCRKCEKFSVEFEDVNYGDSVQGKAKHVDRLAAHEKKCSGQKWKLEEIENEECPEVPEGELKEALDIDV